MAKKRKLVKKARIVVNLTGQQKRKVLQSLRELALKIQKVATELAEGDFEGD